MSISTRLYTFFKGQYQGQDEKGNRYYCHRYNLKKRWVLYKTEVEASCVPPLWNAWLHGNQDELPSPYKPRWWEKSWVGNQTGTKRAYFPKDPLAFKNPLLYTPWTPANKKK